MTGPIAVGALNDKTAADCLAGSAQRGWIPGYPMFNKSSLTLGREAREAGLAPGEYVSRELCEDRLCFAVGNPDTAENVPRILANRHTDLLGSSARGTEFFLRHLIGANNDVNAVELEGDRRPALMTWEESANGKLDLMWTADFRNASTTLHSNVVFPAATWHEKYDPPSTDMYSFMHSFNAAVNSPWEVRTDFETFQTLVYLVSGVASRRLGTQIDALAAPFSHDTLDELANPVGAVPHNDLWVLGVAMSKIVGIERDYTQVGHEFDTLGPLVKETGMPVKGLLFTPDKEVDYLGRLDGTAPRDYGSGAEHPLVDAGVKAVGAVLRLPSTTNGRLAHQGFKRLGA